MAAPGHHPSWLDGIDFSHAESLAANPQLRTQAINRFYHVIRHFEAAEPPRSRNDSNYNRPALIRLTYEYARTPESQDRLLLAFFQRLLLGMMDGDINLDDDLCSRLFAFAEDLLHSLFVPVLAAGIQHTPQITPLSHTAIHNAQTEEEHAQIRSFTRTPRQLIAHIRSFTRPRQLTGTQRQLSTLRSSCLVRDHHRCAITRLFDKEEGNQRLEQQDAQDDDGNMLDPDDELVYLDVAHILPHYLTKEKRGQMGDILNMFDIGIIHEIEGTKIDQPHNALALTKDLHEDFGKFQVVFQHVQGTDPHTYRIKSFITGNARWLPVTRTLFTHPTIDAPSERLLALHCAIGHILHLSAAGDYIQRHFRDMNEIMVQADGSTPLDVMVRIALEMKDSALEMNG